MNTFFHILLVIVIITHVYICVFEMLLWEKRGPKIFKSIPKKLFPETKAMAANQGLYNGFLAAGLIWGLLITDPVWSNNIAMFFLICVITAGLYGSFTIEKKIFFMQGLPALIALLILFIK